MQQILASRLLSTRRGTALLGVAAAVLAGVILLVYLSSYRNSVRTSSEPLTVLVAKSLIEKGTPGSVIASKQLFQATEIAKDQVKVGAISDPALIVDRVAQADVYPGQQLTVTDFSAGAVDSIPLKITRNERAIALELDATHGITGPLRSGDHVDVWRGGGDATSFKLLIANAEVLSAPSTPIGGGGGSVVLKINWWEAPRIAAAQDAGQIWFVLRPQSQARPTQLNSPRYTEQKGG